MTTSSSKPSSTRALAKRQIAILVFLVTIVIAVVSIVVISTTKSTSKEQALTKQTRASNEYQPQEITFSNYTDSGFTATWKTQSSSSTGNSIVVQTPEGEKEFSEQVETGTSHTVEVTGLQPNSIYEFQIKSNGQLYGDPKRDEKPYAAYTMPISFEGMKLTDEERQTAIETMQQINSKVQGPLSIERQTFTNYQYAVLDENAPLRSPILVVIEEDIYNGIQDLFTSWMEMQSKNGHDTEILIYKSGGPMELRDKLHQFYNTHPDTYFVWFIGNIPHVNIKDYFGTLDQFNPDNSYPSDIFYQDLNSECASWEISNLGKNMCTRRIPGPNGFKTDLLIARLPRPSQLGTDSILFIRKFFEKRLQYDPSEHSNPKFTFVRNTYRLTL